MVGGKDLDEKSPGLRERKRQETLKRITDAGICLFIAKGYEATTLDDIAAEAGISRRNFFYYFKSKDDILLSLQSGLGDMLAAAVRDTPQSKRPLDAVRDAIIQVCKPFPDDDMLAIDKLMRSSEAVQARKQASYIQHEKALFEVLKERWPDPKRETALRLTAMMSIGAMRLASDAFSRDGGKRSYIQFLTEAFDALDKEI